jgi:hypothetical protein
MAVTNLLDRWPNSPHPSPLPRGEGTRNWFGFSKLLGVEPSDYLIELALHYSPRPWGEGPGVRANYDREQLTLKPFLHYSPRPWGEGPGVRANQQEDQP